MGKVVDYNGIQGTSKAAQFTGVVNQDTAKRLFPRKKSGGLLMELGAVPAGNKEDWYELFEYVNEENAEQHGAKDGLLNSPTRTNGGRCTDSRHGRPRR